MVCFFLSAFCGWEGCGVGGCLVNVETMFCCPGLWLMKIFSCLLWWGGGVLLGV
jgi:hypothetical protein